MGDERLNGAPSDVVFQLVEIADDKFVRDKNDLKITLEITLQEAILGFSRKITHLDGRQIEIEEGGITQPGSIKIVEGEGMPIMDSHGKGNLFVHFKVKIPDFSGEQLDQLEAFFQKMKK